MWERLPSETRMLANRSEFKKDINDMEVTVFNKDYCIRHKLTLNCGLSLIPERYYKNTRKEKT